MKLNNNHDFIFLSFRYAAAAQINFISLVFNTFSQLNSYKTTLICSPSPSAPWIFPVISSNSFYGMTFSTKNKWIISSEPPGDIKTSYK